MGASPRGGIYDLGLRKLALGFSDEDYIGYVWNVRELARRHDSVPSSSQTRGYSKDRDANAIIALFWMSTLNQGVAPWLEHVPSAAQLADEVSRGDTTLADDEGWIERKFELEPVWRLRLETIKAGVPTSYDAAKAMRKICDECGR